uniref:Threonylcarbamoyl-AMP synthase n=1 Tax=Macaca fascicularis TaxID=9541 RepID=A0A7N9CJQ3_MACFA
MSPARRCRGMRAAVAASVGLSEGSAGSRSGRLFRPPSPAPAAPGPGCCGSRGAGPCRPRARSAPAGPRRCGPPWPSCAPAPWWPSPPIRWHGLACAASCSAALRAVYRLKGRSEAKPLAVCLGRVADVYRYCRVRVPEGLLKDLLPGPVTLVMERSEELNKDLNPFTPVSQVFSCVSRLQATWLSLGSRSDLPSTPSNLSHDPLPPALQLVGIRIPDHAFMQDLAQMFEGPLALTSANLSSQASSLNVEEFRDLWPQLSLVIDGGQIGGGQSPECRLGSTVVDLSVPGKFGIIRPGCALESTTAILQQKYGLLPSHASYL